jgi:hypothetical protein
MHHNGNPRRITVPVIQPGDAVPHPPEEFDELLAWIGTGINWLERLEDEETRQQMVALLDGIDNLHRASLERLVTLVETLGGPGLMARVAQDEVVATLLDLYDLDTGR